MMINRKDIEAYQKSYEEIDIFLKQFPHLKDIALEGFKTKSSKNLFKKLNEHFKNLQVIQEEIIKKHNSLAAQYEELEHLKVNMNDYLGRDKIENEKESIIKTLNREKFSSNDTTKETARNNR